MSFASDASKSRMPRPIASPITVCGPAMPVRVSVEKGAAGVEVARERRLEVGPVAEDDEAQPVALAAGDEVLEHELHRLEPVEAPPVGGLEVPGLHRLREVDREQQVAGGLGLPQRRLDPLRPRHGEHDEDPGERGDEPLQERPPQDRRPSTGRLARRGGELLEERDAHRLDALAVGGQQPPHEEGQRQGEQGQGEAELQVAGTEQRGEDGREAGEEGLHPRRRCIENRSRGAHRR